MKLLSTTLLAALLASPVLAWSQDAVDILLSGPSQGESRESLLLPELAPNAIRNALAEDEKPNSNVPQPWTQVGNDIAGEINEQSRVGRNDISSGQSPLPRVEPKHDHPAPASSVPEPSAALLALAALAYFMFFGRRRRVV